MSSRSRLFHQIVRVETTLWNVLDGEVRRAHGLSLGRAEVLYSIQGAQPVTASDLAQVMSVPGPTIHGFLEWLELAGYCSRKGEVPTEFSTTSAGAAMLVAVDSTIDAYLDGLLGDTISDRAASEVSNALDAVLATVGSLPDKDSLDSHWSN